MSLLARFKESSINHTFVKQKSKPLVKQLILICYDSSWCQSSYFKGSLELSEEF